MRVATMYKFKWCNMLETLLLLSMAVCSTKLQQSPWRQPTKTLILLHNWKVLQRRVYHLDAPFISSGKILENRTSFSWVIADYLQGIPVIFGYRKFCNFNLNRLKATREWITSDLRICFSSNKIEHRLKLFHKKISTKAPQEKIKDYCLAQKLSVLSLRSYKNCNKAFAPFSASQQRLMKYDSYSFRHYSFYAIHRRNIYYNISSHRTFFITKMSPGKFPRHTFWSKPFIEYVVNIDFIIKRGAGSSVSCAREKVHCHYFLWPLISFIHHYLSSSPSKAEGNAVTFYFVFSPNHAFSKTPSSSIMYIDNNQYRSVKGKILLKGLLRNFTHSRGEKSGSNNETHITINDDTWSPDRQREFYFNSSSYAMMSKRICIKRVELHVNWS